MHRRAGVKIYHVGQPVSAALNFRFPVRSMSLLSRPDLASPAPWQTGRQPGF